MPWCDCGLVFDLIVVRPVNLVLAVSQKPQYVGNCCLIMNSILVGGNWCALSCYELCMIVDLGSAGKFVLPHLRHISNVTVL